MGGTARVAVFSTDPPGITTFHAFDPESFTVSSIITDALIFIDTEGAVRPALATDWRRISPLVMELDLRRGVEFHNGEPFDADSVVATFRAHRQPSPSAAQRGILGNIVDVSKIDAFTVRVQTALPDAMLLRRLFLSGVYPRRILEEQGRDYFATRPIGTGPYRFVSYERGREIVLERNRHHWAQLATVDHLHLLIIRQKEWVGRLERGEIDVALNLDSHDRLRASRAPGVEAASRPAANSQWFFLADRGPLADVRVRRAMNHAINRPLLVDVTEHGFGTPQRSIAVEGEQGYVECEPYRYSPELARRLLEAAGYAGGFTLDGIVSETSTAVYFTIKEFLSRVGIDLRAAVVPRTEWMSRVVQGKLRGAPYEGDFAVVMLDNPILHALFHHAIFLYSKGPFSLLRDAEYDERFLATSTVFEESEAAEAQAALEVYARDQALVLFTVHEEVHAAWRTGFHCTLPRSGHFGTAALTSLTVTPGTPPSKPHPAGEERADADTATLIEATSYAGSLFLHAGATFERRSAMRLWENIHASETRWRLQTEPMLRALVRQAEARTHLHNVLRSTERVAIVGYSAEGRRIFVNRGHELIFGDEGRSVFELLAGWGAIRSKVDIDGAWLGPVHIDPHGRPAGAPSRLYLSVTRAMDDENVATGYTFVFSDISGEEERIRHQAIRSILDNVPYGLFMCDREAAVLDGYSDACVRIFRAHDGKIRGQPLPALLAWDPRTAGRFMVTYQQIFDDFMPVDVSIANLPDRVEVDGRPYSLSASVVRHSTGEIAAVLMTLLDVSALVDAERELAGLRSVIEVLTHREHFEEFALHLDRRLRQLSNSAPDDDMQRALRRELHTAKGVFWQFHLSELARQVHAIEDKVVLGADDALALANALATLLERNLRVWDIRLDRDESRVTTTEAELVALEARIEQTATLEDAKRVATQALQRMRCKPVSVLLGPLEEMCAELAVRRGKRVRFELTGGSWRCPPRLARLFEAIPHLIRNSIDHGIESPEERGDKPAVATITMTVREAGGGARIIVRDDGRGVDAASVATRALQLGLVTEARLAEMSHDDVCNLVFVDGLSTSADLSQTSGRGVGMAAVKHLVESLGGTVSLRSERYAGTELSIHVDAG